MPKWAADKLEEITKYFMKYPVTPDSLERLRHSLRESDLEEFALTAIGDVIFHSESTSETESLKDDRT